MPETPGTKALTIDTWLEPDPTWGGWAVMQSGQQERATPARWLESVLAVDLREEAPLRIREQFEVARAAIAYGAFQYSLMTIGVEQLFRITETLARDAARRLTGTETSFDAAIKVLDAHSALTKREIGRLHATKDLRNITSHPHVQQVLPPSEALAELSQVAIWEERLAHLSPSPRHFEERVQECVRWLDIIRDDIYDLTYARRWWTRIGRIVEANNELPGEDNFYGVLGQWYASFLAAGIRRHVDNDVRSVSLRRLLERLCATPYLACNASALEAIYPEFMAGQAGSDHPEQTQTGWAGPCLSYLLTSAEPIRRYVNKHVAHLGAVQSDATYRELHEALNATIDVMLVASVCLTGSAPSRGSFEKAAEQFDWARPLRVQWVTEDVWGAIRDS